MRVLSVIYVAFVVQACSRPTSSRIEIISFQSETFGNERKLRVYLPPGYDGTKQFGVLYLNDGQNAFANAGIKANDDWRVDELTDSLLSITKIEPIVIIGIDHVNREDEYLPWQDIYLHPPLPDPQGKRYPDFITDEVMPLIQDSYKIKKGKEHTGLGGFSYGGLIAAYTAITKPDVFGYLIIESPSFYVDDQRILKEATKFTGSWPDKIYLGIGTNELALEDCNEQNEDNAMAVNDVLSLSKIIQDQAPASRINVFIDSCAVHSYRTASRRFPTALKFVSSQ